PPQSPPRWRVGIGARTNFRGAIPLWSCRLLDGQRSEHGLGAGDGGDLGGEEDEVGPEGEVFRLALGFFAGGEFAAEGDAAGSGDGEAIFGAVTEVVGGDGGAAFLVHHVEPGSGGNRGSGWFGADDERGGFVRGAAEDLPARQ